MYGTVQLDEIFNLKVIYERIFVNKYMYNYASLLVVYHQNNLEATCNR